MSLYNEPLNQSGETGKETIMNKKNSAIGYKDSLFRPNGDQEAIFLFFEREA